MLKHNSFSAWPFYGYVCYRRKWWTWVIFVSQSIYNFLIRTFRTHEELFVRKKKKEPIERMGVFYLPANLSFAKRWLLSIQGKLRLPSPGTALAMGGGTAAVRGLWAGTLITPPGARVKFTPYGLDSSYGEAIPWNVPVSVVYGVALAPVGLPRW